MLVVGIAGGTASGKTTLARLLLEELRASGHSAQLLNMDDYYHDRPAWQSTEERARTNFDHPDAFDTDMLVQHLRALREGGTVLAPVYDFEKHRRHPGRHNRVAPTTVLIVEGICLLVKPQLRDLLDVKVFVEASADVRFIRRLRRDMAERARSADSVCEQYMSTVRPMHALYVEPTKAFADVVVLNEGEHVNPVVVSLLAARATRGASSSTVSSPVGPTPSPTHTTAVMDAVTKKTKVVSGA